MIRRWSLALAFITGIVSFSAYPLGLGEIELDSALNQHLKADIKLLSVNPDELVDVSVKLASPADFKKAGIERTFDITRLRFRPQMGADGNPVIRVTSREPIREPFLNFLLEVNWPNGRMLREYTLLLDPPVTLDRAPAPVRPAVAQTIRGRAPIIQAPATSSGTFAGEPGQYGPVRRNETLWSITKQIKPASVTMQQEMITILRNNPNAFVDNNINRLKAGEILRIPGVDQVRNIGPREAREIFTQQMNQWQADRGFRTGASKPFQDRIAATEQDSTRDRAVATDKLRIAVPRVDRTDITRPGEGAAPSNVVARLQQEVITAREERESAIQEGEELRVKVTELESQLTDLQNLVDLKDNQLARLQALAQERGEAIELDDLTPTQEPADTPAQVVPDVAGRVTPDAQVADAVRPFTEPLAQTEAEGEAGLFDQPVMMGIIVAVLVVFLALAWVVMNRRRTSGTDFQESILVNTMDTGSTDHVFNEDQLTHTTETTSFLSDFTPSDIDALQDETGDVDPLAEADVYVAYGRYQQAEELVQQAIERDPERIPLKHKLFEILYVTKNAGAFLTLTKSSLAEGLDQKDPDGWAKIKTMGLELLPDNEIFSEGNDAIDIDSEISSLEGVLDKDDGLDEQSDLSTNVETDSLVIDGLDNEELHLGEVAKDEQVAETGEVDLDFDLGLDLDLGEKSDKEPVEVEDQDPTVPALSKDYKDADSLDLDLDSLTDIDEEAANLLDIEDTFETAEIENLDLRDQMLDTEDLPPTEGGSSDEISTKLDLARAYVEMGDSDGAKDILEEVLIEGNEQQQEEAKGIINGLA